MTKRHVEIDDDLLQYVMEWLGTKTIKETVELALRDVADQPARLAMVESWLNDPFHDARKIEALEKAMQRDIASWSTRARSSGITSSP
jgi:CO/xanthine dehydrogenase FAD-binding subunit